MRYSRESRGCSRRQRPISVSQANWSAFRSNLEVHHRPLEDANLRAEVESSVNSVTSELVRACDVSMPVSHESSPKPVAWWTVETAAVRGVTRRARRRLQARPPVK